MERVRYDPQDTSIPMMARSDPDFITVPVETSPSPNGLPTSAHLAAGNSQRDSNSQSPDAPGRP
jgi:hypothetical protein